MHLEGRWVRDQDVNPVPSECCSLYWKSSCSVCRQVTAPVASVRRPVDINAVYRLNNLKPSGHYIYRQFNIQQLYVLPTQCIYMFCVDLRTNSDYFPIQH